VDTVNSQPKLRAMQTAATERGAHLELLPDVLPVRKQRRDWILAGILLVVAVIVLRGVHVGEFDYNVDEAQHAVTGLFMADAIRDLPLRNPIQYAYNYYAQYPAVAIVHWPPLFYVFEGLGFLTLGPSAFTARLIVLLFAMLLLYSWYRLVESVQDSTTAAVSTAILGLLPTMLLFEKTVMLEVPSLALGVAAIREWIRYLQSGERRYIYMTGVWTALALLCKQTSVYLLLFFALSVVVTRNWRRLWSRDVLIVAVLGALVVGPFYGFMLVAQGRAVANDLGSHQLRGLERFAFYLRTLPMTLTLTVLLLALLGLALSYRWDSKFNTQIMVCWWLAGYLTFTFFAQRESRFAIYWFPPLVYFAAGLLMKGFRLPSLRMAARVAAIVLIAGLALFGWRYRRPYIAGYKDTAASLVNTYKSGIVLFDGEVPGNFVFYMRALDPARQFLVLRKSLYVNDIRQSSHSEELLHSPAELLDLLRDDGVRFVVVMENAPLRFPVQQMLRDTLQSNQFALRGRFPIQSNETQWQGRNLLLYENTQWVPPTGKVLHLRMLTLNHDILVPIDHFNFAQKPVVPGGTVEKQ
jgi:4-amino-4-deoxy-L-arabinose transferase-like glycosyltransferase